MSDLIDRQAAIDFIDAGHLCNPNEPRWSDNEIVNFLKSRPSAQPDVPDRNVGDMISRQAAIDALNSINCCGWVEDSWAKVSGIIEHVPSAQPERKMGKTLAEEVERIKREITDIFAEQMGVQPSAQSKRMRGRWVKDEEASSQHSESIYVCSACNNMEAWGEVEKNTFKFCPNCGADMRGGQDG